MLGIAGIVHFDGAPVSPEKLQGMVRRMAICPVDYQRQVCLGSVGLAAISKEYVPEDRFEAQPWRTADGHGLLVADAYLTNRDELMPHFGWDAAEAATRADSAFILAAYEKWGEDCPLHLEGRFAFAAWDERRRRLFCAVDHLSLRPLYYWFKGNILIFATTLRGIFYHPEISLALNDEIVADFLASHSEVSAHTLYRDVQRISRGHTLHVEGSGVRTECYWKVDPYRVLRLKSDAEYLEAFRTELTRAIRAGLRTHRQVGILVSGGLDSAAVTAIAGQLLAEQGRRLHAYHRLPPATSYPARALREMDESRYVRLMQSHCPHIDFHFVPYQIREGLSLMEGWRRYFMENYTPFSTLPEPEDLARHPSCPNLDLGTMLNGLGGNFLVSLECWPNKYLSYLMAHGQPWQWLHAARGQHCFYNRSWHSIIQNTLRWLRFPGAKRMSFLDAGRMEFINRRLLARTNLIARMVARSTWAMDAVRLRPKLGFFITDLLAQQQGAVPSIIEASRAYEFHSPMVERRLNEFCLSVPFVQQINQGLDRLLLRRTIAPLLPAEVVYRKTRGFPLPALPQRLNNAKPLLCAAIERLPLKSKAAEYIDLEKVKIGLRGGRLENNHTAGPFLRAASLALFIESLEPSDV